MKHFLLFSLLCISRLLTAQEFRFAQMIHGNLTEQITKLRCTKELDYVATGIYEDPAGVSFESTNGKNVDFKKDLDTFPQSHSTLFLAKYNQRGEIKWTLNASAENGIYPWDMNIDSAGNILVCGNFRGKVIFNSADKKTSKSFEGMIYERDNQKNPLNYFIAKYNKNGILLWAKIGKSNNHSVAFQVETDAKCNIFVRAYCHDNSIAFDTYSILPHAGNYVQSYNFMVLKYTPEGKEQWITYGGGTSSINPREIKVSADGKVSMECILYSSLILFSTNGTIHEEKLKPELHLATVYLKENGEFEKIVDANDNRRFMHIVKKITNAKNEQFMVMTAGSNYFYTTEKPGITWNGKEYKVEGREDLFLAKVNAQNEEEWIVRIGGENDETPLDLIFDRKGNLLISGLYDNSTDIGGLDGKTQHLESELRGFFVASFTNRGNLLWAENCGAIFYSWRVDPFLKLEVNAKNQLFAYGQINLDGEIGGKQIKVLGELQNNFNKSKWDDQMHMFGDAFIARK